MTFNKPLNSIFGQKTKINILRHLALYRKEAATRELARETGIAAPNILKLLKELEAENILISKKIGNSISYSLNRSNLIVKKIILPAFGYEKNLINEFGSYLAANLKMPIVSIILFGSRARGEEKPPSDIDLAFIVKSGDEAKCEKKIIDLNPEISANFGSSVAPIIYSTAKFSAKAKSQEQLVKNIIKEGKIIYGKLISEFIYEPR
ncbi:MAG: nucleotidyltransferase domain-containing protein [Parcubacteria group bacterium]|nr:nucleotidyltransferase domain-containing protein [Parcubacteria group bacterium]